MIDSPSFSIDGAAGVGRFEAWRTLVRPMFDVEIEGRADTFEGKAEVVAVGESLIARTRAQAQSFRRDAGRLRESDWDHIVLQHYTSGGFCGVNGDRELALAPGDFSILDLSRTLETRATSFANLTLVVPRDQWQSFLPGITTCSSISAREAIAPNLSRHLRALFDNTGEMTPEEFAAGVEAVGAVLSGQKDMGGASSASRASIAASLRERLIDWLAGNLSREDLDPRTIAAACGVSRATIYRLAQIDGGLMAMVQKLRLEHARDLLAARHRQALPIAEVAARAGFRSNAHFSRAFRRRYQITPRDFRHLVRVGYDPDVLTADYRLRNWIKTMRAFSAEL